MIKSKKPLEKYFDYFLADQPKNTFVYNQISIGHREVYESAQATWQLPWSNGVLQN